MHSYAEMEKSENLNKIASNEQAADLVLHCCANFDITWFKIKWLKKFQWSFPLFVCFVALRPKSTATVMVGRSVHLTTLAVNQYVMHILSLVTDNNPS